MKGVERLCGINIAPESDALKRIMNFIEIVVKTIIKAMREPTQVMINSAQFRKGSPTVEEINRLYPQHWCWYKMIDCIIND